MTPHEILEHLGKAKLTCCRNKAQIVLHSRVLNEGISNHDREVRERFDVGGQGNLSRMYLERAGFNVAIVYNNSKLTV